MKAKDTGVPGTLSPVPPTAEAPAPVPESVPVSSEVSEPPPAAPAAAPDLSNVGDLLQNARVAELVEQVLENLAARKRAEPALESAKLILGQLEELQGQYGSWIHGLIALDWDAYLAKHPETYRHVERVLTPAGEALKIMQRVPQQLRWALEEVTRLRPTDRDTQVKRIALAVREVGSAGQAIRENIARAEAALEILLPLLQRHGFRGAALAAALRKKVTL